MRRTFFAQCINGECRSSPRFRIGDRAHHSGHRQGLLDDRNPGAISQSGRWFGLETQNGARWIANPAFARCSLSRLPAAGFFRNDRSDERDDWFGGRRAADPGIFSYRPGQSPSAGGAGGKSDDVVDLDWAGRAPSGSESALPPRGVSHPVAKIPRPGAETIAIVYARARERKGRDAE